jgi:CBS domain-containing protein
MMAASQSDIEHECPASDLATTDLFKIEATDTCDIAHEQLTERGYDVAPVIEDDGPLGFIHAADCQEASSGATVSEHTVTLRLSHLIAPDAAFETVLTALYEQPRYFIASQNSVAGILTRADLNSQAARRHLFTYISLFEHTARELIHTHVPEWDEETLIDQQKIERTRRKQNAAAANNADLPLIHYASLSTINTVLTATDQCWKALGFNSDDRARTILDDVRQLRNDVVHSNPIIQSTSRDAVARGRTITELLDTYQQLRQLI